VISPRKFSNTGIEAASVGGLGYFHIVNWDRVLLYFRLSGSSRLTRSSAKSWGTKNMGMMTMKYRTLLIAFGFALVSGNSFAAGPALTAAEMKVLLAKGPSINNSVN